MAEARIIRAVDSLLLYGGSFNPVHHGHLIVARYIAEYLGVAQCVLVPSASPPHKPADGLAPASDRVAMCRLAVAGDRQFEVSDWELTQPGPNYTINTIRHFRTALSAGAQVFWLIGMDTLPELETWYHAAELVELCTIVTAARPGCAAPETARLLQAFSADQAARLLRHIVPSPEIQIAGREIRARVAAGRSIRYLVPEPVRQYIERRGLYRGVQPAAS